jgi:hypothetical protein
MISNRSLSSSGVQHFVGLWVAGVVKYVVRVNILHYLVTFYKYRNMVFVTTICYIALFTVHQADRYIHTQLLPKDLSWVVALTENLLRCCTQAWCRSASDVDCCKTLTSKLNFWSSEQPEVTGCEVWQILWLRHDRHLFFCQEFLLCTWRWHI